MGLAYRSIASLLRTKFETGLESGGLAEGRHE